MTVLIKATQIQSRFSETLQETVVDGRFEIRWRDSEPWLNIGTQEYTECEWLMLVSLMTLGARQAPAVTFIHEKLA